MTTEKEIKKIIRTLEAVLSEFKYVTYADMTDTPSVVKAKRLIEELRKKL